MKVSNKKWYKYYKGMMCPPNTDFIEVILSKKVPDIDEHGFFIDSDFHYEETGAGEHLYVRFHCY